MTDRSVYEFGDVRVDRGRVSVTRGGAPVSLEPKAFDVLVFLIEHRDRVVMRDEILDAVWNGTFVTPNVLTRAVAQIRRVLGEDAAAPYIETVAKRGYRFVSTVRVLPPDEGIPAPVITPAAAVPEHERVPSSARRLPWGQMSPAVGVLALCAAILVAGAVTYVLARQRRPVPADLHLVRLTNRRGYNGTPALSPDGRAVVYASDANGRLELYLAALTPGSGEVALTSDDGQNVEPSWSPDGQWIAFHSRGRGGVWIVPASGGVPRQVAPFGSDPSWSPDSQTIVFTSDGGGVVAQSSLWTVRRDGTARRPLTHVGNPVGGHAAPAWSHDGRHVAFLVTSGGWANEIWTVDVGSGATRRIAASTNAADPAFAVDDRAVYWGGSTATRNGRLFRQDLDADGAPVGEAQVVVPLDAGSVGGVSIAANGTLVFSLSNLDANLWTIDASSGTPAQAAQRLTDDVARDSKPDCGPGGRVVYMQGPIGADPSVWMSNVDGTGRTPLLPGTPAVDPLWESGGRRVLVVRAGGGDKWEFVWVDVSTRSLTPTSLSSGGMMSPRLSPDGLLAYHRLESDGRLSVWTGGFDGKSAVVARDTEAASYPAWSPDGKWLALELNRGDTTQIGIVPREGGPVQQLTDVRGQNWPRSWADNDRIAFAGERGGVWNIYTVSRTTRAIVPLTSFTEATGYVRYPSWCGGSSRVVFERALETASLWSIALPTQ